jgi:hypothetical protein
LIDSDIRIRIKQSRPANLNEAISLAVELEAYNRDERRERELKGYLRSATVEEQPEAVGRMEGWMKAMENSMKTLAEELKELKTSRKTQNNRWRKNSGKKANMSRQELICHECDKPGHIWRNCPTLKNRFKPKYGKTGNKSNSHRDDKGTRKGPQVSVGVGSSIEECGLYVNVIIQGQKTKVLVDTGATVTLVSTRLYDKLSDTVRPSLHAVKQTIMSGNGTPLSVRGKSEFNFTIDKKTYHNDAVVTDIKVDEF